ncbi:MAG: D-alanyl-D-alanine carboxypeptidase [Clostridiales bacterium]|nr:D-alanyl-D-alanine carboxypeptidase [Clostridiales bacterium]
MTMRNPIIAALLLAAAIGSLLPRAWATETEENAPVTISAKAGVLMERETGTILYEENAHEALEPASVTKVMTMLLVAEAIDSGSISLEDMVTTSAYAASMGGSQVYLEEGEQMTVSEMLKAVAVASGNDAAVALAEHLRGSEEAFVSAMNQRAAELGMEDTHFCNCTGLPAEGHLTSAYDIALMSRALLSHEVIRDYTGIWMDTLRDGTFQLANTNKLIYYYDGATGLKTGFTQGAGFCISASAQRDGMELIAVVLGSETSSDRFESAKTLLNYGFGGWTVTDVTDGVVLPPIPVTLGEADCVQTVVEDGRMLIAKGDLSLLTTELTLAETVEAPVEAGDVLGTLTISLDGQIIQELPVTAAESVERKTFGSIFRDMVGELLPG